MRNTTLLVTAGAAVAIAGSGVAIGTADASPTTSHATTVAARTAPQCAESQLRASIDPRHVPGNGTEGAHGKTTRGVLVDFENTSTRTCTLTGYPGSAIENDGNDQVQQARRTLRGELGGLPDGQRHYTPVRLQPGRYAAAMLEGVDEREVGAARAGCDDAAYPRILVTPPNTDIPVPFSVGWPKCYSFDVHPVRALPSAP